MSAVYLSVFPDVRAQSVEGWEGDWSVIVDRLKAPEVRPSKAAMRLLKLARFGAQRSEGGSLRHDPNVQEITGVEGDYDDGVLTLDDAATMLAAAGVQAMLYTSPSCTPERPRWRVLAPLSKPHPPSERARLVARLNGVLGGVLAPESFALSQAFYFGRIAGGSYETQEVRGEYVDLLDRLDATAIGKRLNGKRHDGTGVARVERVEQAESADPVLAHMRTRGDVIEKLKPGTFAIRCPFGAEHTAEGGRGDTVYFLANFNGYARAHFRCLHAHCAARTDDDFLAALGYLARAESGKGEAGTPAGGGMGDDAAIARLAALSPLAYDRVRKDEARRLGVRTGQLDAAVRAARGEADTGQGSALEFDDDDPCPSPVNGADLLDELVRTIRRFVALSEPAARACALWAVHTHAFDLRDCAPLLVITSPEKRCGKTTLLDIMRALVCRPLPTSSISPAALFRVIEAHRPSLLVDEYDTFFKSDEELRGVVNSGHTRAAAYVIRTVGDEHEVRRFSTWAPKLLAGIGGLPETVLDRAVIVELRRKLPSESVERGAGRFDGRPLRGKIVRFVGDNQIRIGSADPTVPHDLHDRAQDNWRPLLALADAAGGQWPTRARSAAVALATTASDGESTGTMLLGDIKAYFDAAGADRVSTKALAEYLVALEERPWGEYRAGRAISPAQLSRRLRAFGVISKSIRLASGATPKGFEREQFAEAWSRYLPLPAPVSDSESATSPQASTGAASKENQNDTREICGVSEAQRETRVADSDGPRTAPVRHCGGVAVPSAENALAVEGVPDCCQPSPARTDEPSEVF